MALTVTGSAGVTPSCASVHDSHAGPPSPVRSRASATVVTKPSRSYTSTADGAWSLSCRASSIAGRYSIRRLGSTPPDAVTTTTGAESSIRLASSLGAKPPNTTECTAPSRAHASIAITDSAIMGMYSSTRSPLVTPWAASAPAKRATRSCNCAYVMCSWVSNTAES